MHAELAYLFRHALTRDAAYQLQLPGDRARLHGLVLDILEGLDGTPLQKKSRAAELAHHARMAQERAPKKLKAALQLRELGHLRMAASYAAATCRHADAMALARRVRDLPCATARDHAIGQNVIVSALIILGQYEAARVAVAEGVELAAQLGERGLEANMLFNACVVAREMGDIDGLGQRSLQALDFERQRPGTEEHARALKARASYLKHRDDNASAVSHLNEALAIFERLGEEREIAGVLMDRGNAHNALGNTLLARRDLDRAEELCRKHNDCFRLALLLINEARARRAAGELDTARNMAAQAMVEAEKTNSNNHRCQILHEMALIEQRMGDESRASEFWEQALEFARGMPGPHAVCVLVRFADNLHKRGQSGRATELLTEAQKFAHLVPTEPDIDALRKELLRQLV